MKKRILSLLLCIVMCLSLMPTVAFAETPANVQISDTGVVTWDAFGDTGVYQIRVSMFADGAGAVTKISDINTCEYNLKARLDELKIETGTYGVWIYTGDKSSEGVTYMYVSPLPRLAEPQNLHWDGTVARWDAVPNATGYSVSLKAKTGSNQYTRTPTGTSYDFGTDAMGGRWFTVVATANNYRNSNTAESPKYGNTTPQPSTYTVTFDANGGSVMPTSAVTGTDGKLATLPTPTRSGSYSFNGWYTEANGGTKVTLDMVYTADTTIYAHWTYTGGGGGGHSHVTYTLTFNTNGGSAISSVSGTYGKVIDLDKYVPTKSGFDFGGWYSDSALTNPVDEIKLNGNKTVYAKWTEKAPVAPAFPFTDVNKTDWSYDDIYYVWEKGLMQGTSETTFAPKTNTSRAMIVTILWRLEDEPIVNYAMSFDDVADGQWYTEAIRWAQANNIVSGYSAEKFGPTDLITREQMAAIFYRYAEFKGYDVSAKADLSKFADSDKISGWALDAIAWANANNLVNGVSTTELAPQGKATREQVAAILHRFCENIVK